MGGASTSQFVEHHSGSVKEVVYLSAVVPRNGESAVSTLLEAGPESALLAEGAFVVAEDQTVTIPPEHARAGFYGLCEEGDVQAALRRICREPIGPLTEALQLGPSFAADPSRNSPPGIGSTARPSNSTHERPKARCR